MSFRGSRPGLPIAAGLAGRTRFPDQNCVSRVVPLFSGSSVGQRTSVTSRVNLLLFHVLDVGPPRHPGRVLRDDERRGLSGVRRLNLLMVGGLEL